jgi:hypothetical protein
MSASPPDSGCIAALPRTDPIPTCDDDGASHLVDRRAASTLIIAISPHVIPPLLVIPPLPAIPVLLALGFSRRVDD